MPFGGGQLKVQDLLILFVGGVVLARAAIEGRSLKQALGPLYWPLVYLGVLVLVSTFYSVMVLRNQFALTEARAFVAWLVLPLLALTIDTPQRLRRLINFMIFSALVIAAYAFAQSIFDINIMGGRVEMLDRRNSDITRSIAGGSTFLMVFGIFLLVNDFGARRARWWLVLPALALLLAGLAANFGRGVWISAGVGLLVCAFLQRGIRGVFGVSMLLAIMLGIGLSGVSLVKPRVVEALIDRVTSVGSEIESGGSFQWRKVENDEAMRAIRGRPLGIGFGGEYKQILSSQGSFEIETRYIHNAYLFYPLKMGWVAAIVPFLFVLAMARMLSGWLRHQGSGERVVAAASAGCMVSIMIVSYTQPEWTTMPGISLISVLLVATLLSRRFSESKPALP